MKVTFAQLTTVSLLFLLGCIPSLNPVYHAGDVRYDPAVLGIWHQQNAAETWEFAAGPANSYRIKFTDREGQAGYFIGHLAEVQGTMFLDLYPDMSQTKGNNFERFHLVPIHTVYLVKSTSPDLVLGAIDFRWFEKYLNEHPDALKSESFNGRRLVTASTEALQDFVIEHKDAFTGEVTLTR